jgi:hypothetical protein
MRAYGSSLYECAYSGFAKLVHLIGLNSKDLCIRVGVNGISFTDLLYYKWLEISHCFFFLLLKLQATC